MATRSKTSFLTHDLTIIGISIVVAVALVRTGALHSILDSAQGWQFLGSFIAGLFFTSVFTTAPAIAALTELVTTGGLLEVAAVGALGSVIGDLIIFRFVKEKFSEHLLNVIAERGTRKRIRALFNLKIFRWMSFVVGGLIIASPLPDELGISLLGFSKMKMHWFIPVSYVFNFIGILLIGLVARAL